MPNDLPFLKQVSRVKHQILRYYLAPWAKILGSRFDKLGYVDCFAGGGRYVDEIGQPLAGSPIIAYREARNYEQQHTQRSFLLKFVERDHQAAERLREALRADGADPSFIASIVEEEDAQGFVERLVLQTHQQAARDRTPTFFFIDPYGHPISVPTIRNILSIRRTEVFVNLMWFAINRNLTTPGAGQRLDRLFGHGEWRGQDFLRLRGWQREKAFVDYFIDQVKQNLEEMYALRFRVRFSPEDNVKGGDRRTKFYLIHLSTHPKAARLMKSVMWSVSDDVTMAQFGGTHPEPQLKLLGVEPDLVQLRSDLLSQFSGRRVTFDDLNNQTTDWPYIEKHYREVLRIMASEGTVRIDRVSSARTGLGDRDIIVFP